MRKYIYTLSCIASIFLASDYSMAAGCSATVMWNKEWTSSTCPTVDEAYNTHGFCKTVSWKGKPNYISCTGGRIYGSCSSDNGVLTNNLCKINVSEIGKTFVNGDSINLDTMEVVGVSGRNLTESCSATIMWQKTWSGQCPSLSEAYNTHGFCKNTTDNKNLEAKLNYVSCNNGKISGSCTFNNATMKNNSCGINLAGSSIFYTNGNTVNLDNMSIVGSNDSSNSSLGCSAIIHWQKDWTNSCPTVDEAYNTYGFCKSTNNLWSGKPNYIDCSNGKIYGSCTFANKGTIMNNKCTFTLPGTGKAYTDGQTIDLTTGKLITTSTRSDSNESCYVTVNWSNTWNQTSCPTPEQAYNNYGLCKTSEWIGKPGFINCKSGQISGSCTSSKGTLVNGKCTITIPGLGTYTDGQSVAVTNVRPNSNTSGSGNNVISTTQNVNIDQDLAQLNNMVAVLRTNNTSDQGVVAALERITNILNRLNNTSNGNISVNNGNNQSTLGSDVIINLTNIGENKFTLNFTKAQGYSRYTFHLINTDTNKLTLGGGGDSSCNNSSTSTCSFTIGGGSSSDKYGSFNLTPGTNYKIEVHASVSIEDSNYKIVQKTFKTLGTSTPISSNNSGSNSSTYTSTNNSSASSVEEMVITNIGEKSFSVEFNKVQGATTHTILVYDNTNKQTVLNGGYDSSGCDNANISRCIFKVGIGGKYNDPITAGTDYMVVVKAYGSQQALKQYTKNVKTLGTSTSSNMGASSIDNAASVITSSSDISITDISQRSFTVKFNKASGSTGNYVYVQDKSNNSTILSGGYDSTCDQSSSNSCSFKVGVGGKYNDSITPGTPYKVTVKTGGIYHTAEFTTAR